MDNPFAHKGKKRRKRRGPDSSDCCCVVDELFDPCFIATAAYDGKRVAEPVRTLRRYRDKRLTKTAPGRAFIRVYYRYGRYGARFLRRFPIFKPAVRLALRPLVAYARKRVR